MDPNYRQALESVQERLNELAAELESLPSKGLPTGDQFRAELVREYLTDMQATAEAKLNQ